MNTILTVRQRLVSAFSLITLLAAGVSAFTIYTLNQLNANAEKIQIEQQPILTDITEIESNILIHSLKFNQYITTGNEAHLQTLDTLSHNVEKNLADLVWLEGHGDLTEQKLIQAIRDAYNAYLFLCDEMRVAYERDPNDTASIATRQMSIAALLENSLLPSANALYQTEQRKTEELIQASRSFYDLSAKITIISDLLLIGLGAVLGFVISWSITIPVDRLITATQKLARGDLQARAQITSRDEIGVLAQAFNTMAARLSDIVQNEQQLRGRLQTAINRYITHMAEVGQGNLSARVTMEDQTSHEDDPLILLGKQLNTMTANLQQMISQTHESAHRLSTAVNEILAATTQQAAGASEQSAAIAQTTTTVDEVKTTSEQAILRAQEVADASQRTVKVSQSGQKTVQETIESMNQIKERVESIAENILVLSEKTQQIGTIITTVSNIATQSNILALNAAIEAERAGEHGKGFAVVAAEVRNLAAQSKQATAQVKAILTEIQKATNTTVMATEEGTKGVERGVQLAAQTGEAIRQLAAVIEESAQAATQMVAGGRQQAAGIEQIALAMQNINQATTQSLASTRQAEKAAQDLNELARRLTETVAQYQL